GSPASAGPGQRDHCLAARVGREPVESRGGNPWHAPAAAPARRPARRPLGRRWYHDHRHRPGESRRPDMIRILLADDHDVVRRGLRGILEEHEGWEVCGEATNGREAVELAL